MLKNMKVEGSLMERLIENMGNVKCDGVRKKIKMERYRR